MTIHTVLIWVTALLGFSLFILVHPIQQDAAYHLFVGDDCHHNQWCRANVLSNLGFLLAGIYGITLSLKNKTKVGFLWWVSVGLLLTSIGSSYYHMYPTNATLFWDRLPMTIVFSGFFAAAWQYYNSSSVIRSVLYFLIGVGSVFYWKISTWLGVEDLRMYVMVQFVPILWILGWVFFDTKSDKIQKCYVVLLVLFYMLAKLFEKWDVLIWDITQHLVSGHTLKHLFAAIASVIMLRLINWWSLKITESHQLK